MTMLGFIGVTATAICFLLMPLAVHLSRWVAAIDEPGERRMHQVAIPRLGGVAITMSVVASSLLYLPMDDRLLGLLWGLIIAMLIGVVDDIWQIKPLTKLVGQIIAASVFVIVSDVSIGSFGNLLGFGEIRTGTLAVPITIFAIVAMMNAMNLADGLDGLAGGLTLIASSSILLFAFASGHSMVGFMLLALIGSVLAFLYYNMHPARIFMGDSGALSLGFLLSAISILLVYDSQATRMAPKPISLALILALPILDTLSVMIRRVSNGLSPAFADNRHLHHVLMKFNLSASATVSVLYAGMVAFCLIAVFMRNLPEWVQFTTAVGLAGATIAILMIMSWRDYKVEWSLLRREPELFETRLFLMMRKRLEASVPVALWIVPLALINPAVSFPRMRSDASWFSFAVGALIVLLFPWRSNGERSEWVHGLLYVSVVMLLVHLNINGPGWTPVYLRVVAVVLSAWVLLNLVFRQQLNVFKASSFEFLMLLVVWLMPFLTLRTSLDPASQQLVLHACIESIPFLLAMKIMLNTSARNDRYLILGLAFAFMFVGVRQLLAALPGLKLF